MTYICDICGEFDKTLVNGYMQDPIFEDYGVDGSSIMEYIEEIWGCELIEHKLEDGTREIAEIVYTIDNTTKTRALRTAISKVKDGKQILVDLIPVGEVFYE